MNDLNDDIPSFAQEPGAFAWFIGIAATFLVLFSLYIGDKILTGLYHAKTTARLEKIIDTALESDQTVDEILQDSVIQKLPAEKLKNLERAIEIRHLINADDFRRSKKALEAWNLDSTPLKHTLTSAAKRILLGQQTSKSVERDLLDNKITQEEFDSRSQALMKERDSLRISAQQSSGRLLKQVIRPELDALSEMAFEYYSNEQ